MHKNKWIDTHKKTHLRKFTLAFAFLCTDTHARKQNDRPKEKEEEKKMPNQQKQMYKGVFFSLPAFRHFEN